MDEYFTIDTSVKGPIIKEKKSKFLGYAFPVESEEAIQLCLESIRKEHPAASHICYAWRLAK